MVSLRTPRKCSIGLYPFRGYHGEEKSLFCHIFECAEIFNRFSLVFKFFKGIVSILSLIIKRGWKRDIFNIFKLKGMGFTVDAKTEPI